MVAMAARLELRQSPRRIEHRTRGELGRVEASFEQERRMRDLPAGAAALEQHAMALGFQRLDAVDGKYLRALGGECRIGGNRLLHRLELGSGRELDVQVTLLL